MELFFFFVIKWAHRLCEKRWKNPQTHNFFYSDVIYKKMKQQSAKLMNLFLIYSTWVVQWITLGLCIIGVSMSDALTTVF